MSKHTPGPWFFEAHKELHNRKTVVSIQNRERFDPAEDDDDPTIAGIWSTDPVDFANARLISAAPELLEALEDIASDYAERFDMDSPSTNPGMKIVVENARAAIAKARGES